MSVELKELLGKVASVRELVVNTIKTDGEKREEFEKRFASLEASSKRLGERSQIFPDNEPDLARYKGPGGMDRLMMANIKQGRAKTMVEDFQRTADDLLLLAAVQKKTKDGGDGVGMLVNLDEGIRKGAIFGEFERQRGELQKALDTATTGEGLEWIPTGFSQQIAQLIELTLRIPSLFPVFDMPQNPFDWPYAKEKPEPQHISESTTSTGNPFGNLQAMRAFTTPTAKTTFDAEKMRLVEVYTRELAEDAVAPTIPWLRERLVSGVAQGTERFILNGDTAATHMDDDTAGATNPVEGMVDGLRDYGVNTNANTVDFVAAVPTVALMRAVRKKMLVFGVNPAELIWIVGVQTYLNMLSMTEVQTPDKYGTGATLLTGELARFDGIPVIVSEHQRENVAATGVNTSGGPNTLATLLLVHPKSWMRGRRANSLGLETVRLAPTDQEALVMFERADFQFLTANTADHVAVGRNILV